MRAQLKRLHSPDIDIDTYKPEDTTNFGFLLQAMIGPEGQDSEESFDIQVCTPDWLKSQHSASEAVFGRHMLIVFEYDKHRIEQAIARYCERCVGNDWQEIAERLGRIGQSEFEDYVPAR
jgi:hypothetical protein